VIGKATSPLIHTDNSDQNRNPVIGKANPLRRHRDAENSQLKPGLNWGIPGDELCKPFRILVGVGGGVDRVIIGHLVIGKPKALTAKDTKGHKGRTA
jgi:hypothetical protein